MKQVMIIHGGNSFSSYDKYLEDLKRSSLSYDRLLKTAKWRDWLADALNDTDVLLPDFPNKQNAQYEEWKIYFEKMLPLLGDDVSLVGYSLGAMFLAKYLQTTPLETKARRIVLIAPCYDNNANEDLGSFGIDSATALSKSSNEIHIFHSTDDPVCPFSELQKFERDIPSAETHIFRDRGHFFQPTFPELRELLAE